VTTWAGLTVYVIYINEKNKTKCHAVGTVDIGRIDRKIIYFRGNVDSWIPGCSRYIHTCILL
jgi:hypothetical protein